jgi:hypothetical protein
MPHEKLTRKLFSPMLLLKNESKSIFPSKVLPLYRAESYNGVAMHCKGSEKYFLQFFYNVKTPADFAPGNRRDFSPAIMIPLTRF